MTEFSFSIFVVVVVVVVVDAKREMSSFPVPLPLLEAARAGTEQLMDCTGSTSYSNAHLHCRPCVASLNV